MSEQMLAAATDDPKIGLVVQDRYRIVKKIGEGGMGAVYEGKHVHIGRRVAIKCMHAQFITNQEMVNRFQREAMAANEIRHPNIVEVTDMGRFDDGGLYQVLEFLEGTDLGVLLEEGGALPLGRVVHIASQVCDGLTAAHAANIVHRDLKPDNVFLFEHGETSDFVKLLDFGIAKFRTEGGHGLTKTGTTLGTPHYMAPEQAQASKDLDQRADIYALGVILFHAITGVLPFDDESFPMLMVKVVTHPAPWISQLVPSIPPAIDQLVNRMLAKRPEERPSSCAEVKAALAPFRQVQDAFAATATAAPTSLSGTTPGAMARLATPTPGTGSIAHASGPHRAAGSGPSSRGMVIAGVGVGALLLVSAAIAGAFLLVPTEEVVVDDTPPPVPAAAPTPQPATREGPGTEAGPMVHVRINVQPAGAQLFLDGERISNPFDARLPQTSEARQLEAHLDGYQTVTQEIVLRYEQTVNIALEREGAGDTAERTNDGPSGRGARRGSGRRGQAAAAEPGGGSAAPTTPSDTGGSGSSGSSSSGSQRGGFQDLRGAF